MKLSVSILSTDNKIEYVRKLNNTKTDYIHIDVMDGLFVPDTKFPIEEIKEINKISEKKLDIHLMVEDPIIYVERLNSMNINNITIHIEINKDIDTLIDKINSLGYRARIAISPNTNVKLLEPYLNKIEGILIMSVNPGKGGQEFIPSTLSRAEYVKRQNNNLSIEIDGGVNNTNVNLIKDSGIDTIVVGSYITKSEDYLNRINNLISV
jgi:ribulose-phosphate 3-epimerase